MSAPTQDIIIVGSGPAGYTAGLYAARAGLKPLIIAGSVTAGGALMNTTEVENYPGFPDGIMGPELMDAMQAQAERFGAEILYDDVTAVTLAEEAEDIHVFTTGEGSTYRSRAAILSMGAQHRHLEVPGEERLGGHGVSYCGVCDAFFFKGKDVIVVGGGDSALEDATFLARFAKTVTIVHRRDSFRASQAMVKRLEQHPNIKVLWNTVVTAVNGGEKVESVDMLFENRSSYTLPIDGVFVAVGHTPRSELVKEQVAVDASGYVLVHHPRTNVVSAYTPSRTLPGVFACGDLVDKHYRQAITAAGTGCASALDAQRYLERYELVG